MNDNVPPADPAGSDAPLDDDALAQLQERLRDVPGGDAATRAAHLAAAMDAFDEQTDTVVPLRSSGAGRSTRRQRTLQRLAVAAGVLVVTGIGVALAVRHPPTSSEDTAASMSSESAQSTTAIASSKSASPPEVAGGTGDSAADAAPADAAAGSVNGSEQIGSTSAGDTIPDLGAFADDAALLRAAGNLRSAVPTTVPSGADDHQSPAPRSGGSDASTTVAPGQIMGAIAPSCPLPPGAHGPPVARAIVAGRAVEVVATTTSTNGDSAAPPSSGLVVVDLLDCSSRPL